MTADEFHDALHLDVGRPRREVRTVNVGKHEMKQVVEDPWAHRAKWVSSQVFLRGRDVKVQINLNLKRNKLGQDEYQRLCQLVMKGVRWNWSRSITIRNETFNVWVNPVQVASHAVDVDLEVERGNEYGRSYNMAILGIDATFIYNAGFFPSQYAADDDFMRTSAHEFGHSVLMEFGGLGHSWTHKGSTSIFQKTTASTPGYPASGEIDLMKYYDEKKRTAASWRISSNTRASELDVKCLLWMSKLSF